MSKIYKSLLLLLSIFSALFFESRAQFIPASSTEPRPPQARRIPNVREIHGYRIEDDYFWLREKTNPEVMNYLKAENAYTEAIMKPTVALQEKLYREMLSRVKETDSTVPNRNGAYFYYSRTEAGKQHRILCRKSVKNPAKEEILLDLNALSEGKFISLGIYSVSDDGNYLAYSIDRTGYYRFTLYIKDLRTGRLLPEKIERAVQAFWSTDNKTLFYTSEDPVNKRINKFYRHEVGSGKPGELLFEENDELFDLFLKRSRDRQMILLNSQALTSGECYYLPANAQRSELKMLWRREPGHEYTADYDNGYFYIRTNKNAKNFRIVRASAEDLRAEAWQEFVAHKPEVKIAEMNFFEGYLVLSEREDGAPQLRVIEMKTGESHRIPVREPNYTLELTSNGYGYFDQNPEYRTQTIHYTYESPITPSSVFAYDLKTRRSRLIKQQEIPGGFNAQDYAVERKYAVARDGTRIPVVISYKKGVRLDGSAPMNLFGYGSYGYSFESDFSAERLSLLNRGVIYAVAQIRGGGELGEEWREQGRMMKKMNTFTDFIDSAEWLIKNKYTSPDRLVISGGSAGGLLVGAVTNMRPELFKAVVASVPFVDVINTMLDPDLPLTTSEYVEWGNPNKKEEFDYIRTYSPYDNIKAQNYPAMLVEVSVNDASVPYWEGAKMVARLRATKTDNNPLLLKTNLEAGHGGPSGRYQQLRRTAFTYAFMLSQMGIKN